MAAEAGEMTPQQDVWQGVMAALNRLNACRLWLQTRGDGERGKGPSKVFFQKTRGAKRPFMLGIP